ncbi:hypothetical protein ABRZ10_07165 [Castellaniella ginsengisoli]|uniref:Uncharacterized protein n=1 Tax=Castellaniella ginsengisoli TaxID=546114 RepID=A0AB39DVC6_9BURK
MAWLIEIIKTNRPWENIFAGFIFATAAVSGFFVALTTLGWAGLLDQGVAAWVQAFGSIGAIVGAVIIGERQLNNSLKIYADGEKRKDKLERDRHRQDIYAFMLMIWRMGSFIDIHISCLRNKGLIRVDSNVHVSIGKGRDLILYNKESFSGFKKEHLLLSSELALMTFINDRSTAYVTSKIIESLNGVNLLRFPYSAIAEQILVYVACYERLYSCLDDLVNAVNAEGNKFDDNGLDNEVKKVHEAMIELSNCGCNSVCAIQGFYEGLSREEVAAT